MAADESKPALDRLLAAAFARKPAARGPAPAGPEPLTFGARYQVVGEIGRGGVGVVYRGHDQELERDVAIKVLRAEHKDHAGLAARFVAEARITGRLEHPGTVPVHEIGTTSDGRPWFAMKLIQGQTLASLLFQRATPSADRARFVAIFEQVCQTVAHAHARGVIHRDLKPANVMVGAFAEVQVADWGLAKVLGAPPSGMPIDAPFASVPPPTEGSRTPSTQLLSQAGSVLGTLAYMPPEQARGEQAKVDARADVFALGALLCEILTGRPPYVGEVDEVFDAAREARLGGAFARLDGSGADADLVLLAKRCLAADVAARPLDAGEVAAAVARHRASLGERARAAELAAAAAEAKARGERRSRRLVAALAATIVLAVVVAGAGYQKVDRDERRRQEEAALPVREAMKAAETELARAKFAAPEDVAPWQAAQIQAERAESAAQSGRPAAALVAEVAALLGEVRHGLELATRANAIKRRDAEMKATIERITSSWNIEPWAQIDAEFAAAFRDYGCDFATTPDDAIIARLQASPTHVELAQGIFGWIRVRWELTGRHGAPQDFERFLRICQEVDPDPWRVRIRGALATADFAETIRAIADEAEHAEVEMRTTFFLGFMLAEAGFLERAVDLFRAAFTVAPDQHLLALQIAQWSHAIDPPRWEDSLAYATAAVAIWPPSTSGWYEVGLARDALGDGASARAAFSRALVTTPAHVPARVALVGTELRAGDLAAAAKALDETPAPEPSDPDFVRARAELLLRSDDVAQAVERLGALADRQATGELATMALLSDFSTTLDLLYQSDATARAIVASEKSLLHVTPMTLPPFEVALRQIHSALLVLDGRADQALRELDRIETLFRDREHAAELDARRAQLTALAAAERRFDALATGEWTPENPLDFARAARVAARNGATALATSLWEQALGGDDAAVAAVVDESSAAFEDAAQTALAAATRRGDDAASLNEAAVTRCSALARGWLARAFQRDLAAGAPRGRLRLDVERWLRNPRLRTARAPRAEQDSTSSHGLGSAEADAWEKFFEEARAALKAAPSR